MSSSEEITEVTYVVPKKRVRSSVWMNMAVLFVLAVLILGGRLLSEQWEKKPTSLENFDKEIVLEDLENKKPLLEPEVIEMPAVKKFSRPMASLKREKSKFAKEPESPEQPVLAEPDPYTDSGPEDLDSQFYRQQYQNKKEEASATPLLPLNERDQFIPFE